MGPAVRERRTKLIGDTLILPAHTELSKKKLLVAFVSVAKWIPAFPFPVQEGHSSALSQVSWSSELWSILEF